MVEGARLEIVCRVKPIEGSNPSLSATRMPPPSSGCIRVVEGSVRAVAGFGVRGTESKRCLHVFSEYRSKEPRLWRGDIPPSPPAVVVVKMTYGFSVLTFGLRRLGCVQAWCLVDYWGAWRKKYLKHALKTYALVVPKGTFFLTKSLVV